MQITLDVSGMKCAGCVQAVENELTSYQGVIKATVNLVTEVAVVECENEVLPQSIATHLTNSGFPTTWRISHQSTAQIWLDKQAQNQTELLWQLISAAILLGLSAIGHITPNHHQQFWLNHIGFHWGLATLALLFPGRDIIIDGTKSLLKNRPNMNTLIGLGTTCAYFTSVIALIFPSLGWECFFDEPVMMIGFITLGKSLEKQAKQKAALAIKKLLSLQNPIARLVSPQQPNQSIQIPVDQVKINDWLQILPGETIPLDGIIKIGQTTVDESIITGESLPIQKSIDSQVIGGSINKSDSIIIAVTHIGNDTTLSQIISLVETAQTRKAPIQRFADYVAGYFTYGVITIAIATLIMWSIIGYLNPSIIPHQSSFLFSLKMAITVLVIACPCALGLATPTAILVGTGIGATSGLLIKGGDVLEKISQVNTLVFDKTGTLTKGKLQVTEVITYNELDKNVMLNLAAIAEINSNHPVREAILQAANDQNQFKLINSQNQSGLGVKAEIQDLNNDQIYQVYVGNHHWLESQGINTSTDESITWLNQGKTPIYVGINGQLAGMLAIADQLRLEAIDTIKDLQSQNYQIILLTGDRQIIANQIAEQLGIKQVYAEVLPGQKAKIIQQLQEKNQVVAMIGDGINDAPALVQADVGIALNTGTDIASASADIVLIKDSLTDISTAIKLAKATFKTINQNLFWAVIYNILAIPAAVGIFYLFGLPIILTPAIAGAMMATSSISVVLNSLKLKWFTNWQN